MTEKTWPRLLTTEQACDYLWGKSAFSGSHQKRCEIRRSLEYFIPNLFRTKGVLHPTLLVQNPQKTAKNW